MPERTGAVMAMYSVAAVTAVAAFRMSRSTTCTLSTPSILAVLRFKRSAGSVVFEPADIPSCPVAGLHRRCPRFATHRDWPSPCCWCSSFSWPLGALKASSSCRSRGAGSGHFSVGAVGLSRLPGAATASGCCGGARRALASRLTGARIALTGEPAVYTRTCSSGLAVSAVGAFWGRFQAVLAAWILAIIVLSQLLQGYAVYPPPVSFSALVSVPVLVTAWFLIASGSSPRKKWLEWIRRPGAGAMRSWFCLSSSTWRPEPCT